MLRHSVGILRHSVGILRHSVGMLRHSVGMLRHSVGILRHSVGTYQEMSFCATCQGMLCHSHLSLLSHCGLILA